MIISTMNDLPGYEIDEVPRRGVRAHGALAQRRLADRRVAEVDGRRRAQGHDEDAQRGREHATERLVEEAEAKGANAVIAFRFDTSELGATWTEICAYGTAVTVAKCV